MHFTWLKTGQVKGFFFFLVLFFCFVLFCLVLFCFVCLFFIYLFFFSGTQFFFLHIILIFSVSYTFYFSSTQNNYQKSFELTQKQKQKTKEKPNQINNKTGKKYINIISSTYYTRDNKNLTCTNDYKIILQVCDNNHIKQFKSKHHFLKWRDNFPPPPFFFFFFLDQIIFQITFTDKKRVKRPKVWDVILKLTAANIKFTTQQKMCEPTFLRETN